MTRALPETFPLKPTELPGLLTEFRDGVLVVTFNRPESGNGMTIEMSDSLMAVLSDVGTDERVRAVVLTGAGRLFSAGGDVALIERNVAACRSSREEAYALQEPTHVLAASVEQCPRPVIAAVNGAAAGMGLVLCLASDIVVAAADARFVYAYTNVGIPGDGGVTRRLARRVGLGRALEFAYFDKPLDAETALDWGLANAVTPEGEPVLDRALELAGKLARGPAKALAGIKRAMRAEGTAEEHVGVEIDAFIDAAKCDDVYEGIAAIREKRRPDFRGAR